ncbi:MAG: AGE family epimerase/isomerase [Pseudomonadota bacterium]
MKYKIHPVILCGGAGTRLWPLSTPEMPKQFLALTTNRSMIEETAHRLSSVPRPDLEFSAPLIIGSKHHEALLSATLPDARKILEPFGRNSAPAVAAACLTNDPDDLVLILSADHDIRDVPAFQDAIAIAAAAAETGAIVTFGIEPSHPATGYGYIKAERVEAAIKNVEEFVEKPDLATAERYLEAGTYYWNAGIFLFKVSAMIEALNEHAPDVLAGTRKAMPAQQEDPIHLVPDAFAATPSISIDYAVMEKAQNVKTVPVQMGWSDIGGYHALHSLLTEDDIANYTSGPVFARNSEGLYVRSKGPTVAVNGVSNLVIIATETDVMITPTSDDAAVKILGSEVQSKRTQLGFSTDLKQRAQAWLWNAFERWSESAWDDERGGFVEQIGLDGRPDLTADRRVRVQARQIYSFAQAVSLGWPQDARAQSLMDQGLEFLDSKLRAPDGGWVHVFSADGAAKDQRRNLYDHAFIILAGSAAFNATGSQLGLKIAQDAMAFVEARLKDATNGGWEEQIPAILPRRSNPHMHMLEAMLAYHNATGDSLALKRAGECVTLFEKHFFDPATDVMSEFFNEDWSTVETRAKTVFEPGHHYEWATLLSLYDAASGHDSLSWRRRLIRRADATGLNPKTGFAFNSLRQDGEIMNQNSRLWHQLEMFRAYMVHPGVATRAKAEVLLERIFESYLDRGPDGGFIDEVDETGAPISKAVPASMMYHTVTAFVPLI